MHFHQMMLTASADEDYAHFGRTVADALHRRTMQGLMPATPDPTALRLHEELFESVQAGDPVGAERATRGIIDEADAASMAGCEYRG